MNTRLRSPRLLPIAVLVALAASASVALSACGGEASSSAAGGRVQVATTVAPITSIAANIGGDRVKITGIVPEGTNSHTFEPKPSVAELLSSVDVVYVNGLKLEDPTVELAEQNLRDGADIVEVGSRSIPESRYIYDFSFPRSDGKPNPHLWTDPQIRAQLRAHHPRRPLRARPEEQELLRRELPQVCRGRRGARHGDAEVVRHDSRGQAQAAHLPRRVRLLRQGLRVEGHRRDPGIELRGPDPQGGREPDRPGEGREGARRSSAPRSSRARCSSRSARRRA